jgi:hypothetical protein
MKRKKTPQQKKAESYAHDRRSIYGNNDKAARRTVPLRRQQRAQAERRVAKQTLAGVSAADDETRIDLMLDQVAQKRRKAWRKWPDESLGVVLARRKKRRNEVRG